ncbi:MAG: hypothetical protein KDC46_06045 [Thermoleophilia bacterium]|nr:hypothetical protein [Thermoleophilia bacterium]
MASVVAALSYMPAAAHAAPARFTAKTTVVDATGGVRIVAILTANRSLAVAERPRTVSVRLGTRTVALTRLARPLPGGRRAGTWRTAILTGATRKAALALRGKRPFVTLRFRKRAAVTLRPVLVDKTTTTTDPGTTDPGTTDPGTTTPTPLFQAPATALEGNAAFDHISQYFLNARFTNCVAGWPNCPATAPVVERYVHCPDGSWQYHRESSISGADIHSYYTFSVTGASAAVDGSWAVSYTTSTGGNYSWQVAADGTVNGQYQYGSDPVEALGPFVWASTGC